MSVGILALILVIVIGGIYSIAISHYFSGNEPVSLSYLDWLVLAVGLLFSILGTRAIYRDLLRRGKNPLTAKLVFIGGLLAFFICSIFVFLGKGLLDFIIYTAVFVVGIIVLFVIAMFAGR